MSIYERNKGAFRRKKIRKTIRWHLPAIFTEGVPNESIMQSGTLIGDKYVIPMYINPSQLSINYSKIINESLTKGGYVVQYWGEKNLTLSINGTTGSSGIEGIFILERVYRHEQYEFEKVLKNRLSQAKLEIKEAAINAAADLNNISQSQSQSLSVSLAQTAEGLESVMDLFSSSKVSAPDRLNKISTGETLGALATQIEMHHDGIIHQGYFTTFSYVESAAEPGLFTYSLNFTVLKSEGSRDNFMLWHRSPFESNELGFQNGNVRQSSTSADSPLNWNLSFPFSENKNKDFPKDIGTIGQGPSSTFSEDQSGSIRLKPAKRRK